MEEKTLTGYPSIDKPWLKYYTEKTLNSKPFSGSLYEHVYENNKDFPNDIALIYYGAKTTYSDMFKKIDDVESALRFSGVKRGDNVALLITACPEMIYLVLALNKIGAVANMINPLFDKATIADRINETDASLLVALDQLYGCVRGIEDKLCINKTVIVPITYSMPLALRCALYFKLKKNIAYSETVVPWPEFLQFADQNCCQPLVHDESLPAIMVYSSGTTGVSKGIVLTNKGINSTIAHYEFTDFEYDRGDTNLQIIPCWFSTGIVFCCFMPMCLGITDILEPVFNEKNFSDDILKYKPNLAMGATSQWLAFLKRIERKPSNLSFLKYPITGGEQLLQETEQRINKVLKDCGCPSNILTGYGMCELGSTVTATSKRHWTYGTVGYPILGVTVSVFNTETDEECKFNERGEIRVLSPARMENYYKKPEATAEFFRKDNEGKEWGCTGDIGYMDEDGYIFVQGRDIDAIVPASGKKQYLFDIEAVLLKNTNVYQCEVVGRKTEAGFEEPVAFIVLKPECLKTHEEIIAELKSLCEVYLEKEIRPVAYYIMNAFPVKPSGKRDVEQLKKLAEDI